MKEWSNWLEVIFLVWILIAVADVLWKIIIGVKTHLWSPFKCSRVNFVEKYGTWAGMGFTVVTGASDGIGKEYAKGLAARGLNIVLIGPTLEDVKIVACEIEKNYNVETKIIAADFGKNDEFIYERIEGELKGIPVGILVNNVDTMGRYPMYYTEMTSQDIWSMIRINIVAASMMTKIILPQMSSRRRGAIVNISTVHEIMASPLDSVYSGSKAFIKNFTEALSYECTKYGITVQHLSPDVSRTKNQFNLRSPLLMSPETYATSAINTLGLVDHSGGHWFLGILYYLIKNSPPWLGSKISGGLNETKRREWLQRNKQERSKDPNSSKILKDE